MLLGAVWRNLEPERLEDAPVANGPVSDDPSSRRELEVSRGDHHRAFRAAGEHLASRGVDHGHGSRSAGREGIERGHAGHRDLEGQREPARRRDPHADSREASGADSNDQRVEISRGEGLLGQELVGVREHADRLRRPLCEQLVVRRERDARDRRRCVKGQD
jgi:hypothetical protein